MTSEGMRAIFVTGFLRLFPKFGPRETCLLEATGIKQRKLDFFSDVTVEMLNSNGCLVPMVFLDAPDDSIEILELSDLLFSQNGSLRNRVLEIFVDGSDFLVPRTQHCLLAAVDSVISDFKWQSAAVKVHAQLYLDWILSLQGLRVSATRGFDPGVERYYERALFPKHESIDSIQLWSWSEKNTVDYKVVLDNAGFQEAYKLFGFSPFEASSKKRSVEMVSRDQFVECYSWADRNGSTAKCFLAFLLLELETLPDWARSYLDALLESVFGPDRTVRAELRVIQLLASHFGGVLDGLWPEVEPDRSYQLAWWMAQELSDSLMRSEYWHFCEDQISQFSETATYVRELFSKRRVFSKIYLSTHSDFNPWSALLASKLALTNWTPPANLAAEFRTACMRIVCTLRSQFQEASSSNTLEPSGLFESVFVEYWHRLIGWDCKTLTGLNVGTTFPSHMERFPTLSKADAVVVADHFRKCCLLEAPDCSVFDRVWELCNDAAWLKEVLSMSNEVALSLFLDGACSLVRRQLDKWTFGLQHLVAAEIAVTGPGMIDDEQTLYRACNALLVTSFVSSDFSAWARLKGDRRLKGWVQARIGEFRQLLPMLSQQMPYYAGSARLGIAKLAYLWSIDYGFQAIPSEAIPSEQEKEDDGH